MTEIVLVILSMFPHSGELGDRREPFAKWLWGEGSWLGSSNLWGNWVGSSNLTSGRSQVVRRQYFVVKTLHQLL